MALSALAVCDNRFATRSGDRERRDSLCRPRGAGGTIPRAGAVSSVGRAPARQAGGHWFEPSTAHTRKGPVKQGLLYFEIARRPYGSTHNRRTNVRLVPGQRQVAAFASQLQEAVPRMG